ncbi:hypothetical protein QOT17_025206 [Balamuthia mandrillaris]
MGKVECMGSFKHAPHHPIRKITKYPLSQNPNIHTKTTNKMNHKKPLIITSYPAKKPSLTTLHPHQNASQQEKQTPPNTLIANRYQSASQNQPTSYPVQYVHKYSSCQNCFSPLTINKRVIMVQVVQPKSANGSNNAT